jgi:hypothetical protein
VKVAEEKLAVALAQVAEETAGRKKAEDGLEELRARLAEIETNPLHVALNYLEGGETARDAGRQLAELTSDVLRLSAKGRLTLEIGLKAFKAGSVTITGKVTVKRPVATPEPSVFYLDGGKLSRTDPNQGEFGFSKPDRSPSRE